MILSNFEIQKLIPQKPPFLYLDAISSFVDGESISGVKAVSISDPCFIGHFPGQPILPGVLMIESLAQLCAVYTTLSGMEWKEGDAFDFNKKDAMIGVLGSTKTSFLKPVLPGQTLVLNAMLKKDFGNTSLFDVTAVVNGDTVVKGSLGFSKVNELS